MAKRAPAFTQADLTRATKAMRAAGCEVARVDIMPDGRLSIWTGAALPPQPENEADQFFRSVGHAR